MRDPNRIFYRHFHKGRRLKATIATKVIDDKRVAVGVTYVDKADKLVASRKLGRKIAEERLNALVAGKTLEQPYMAFVTDREKLAMALKNKTFFSLAPSWTKNTSEGFFAFFKRTYRKALTYLSK
jgi:hypothetical protein